MKLRANSAKLFSFEELLRIQHTAEGHSYHDPDDLPTMMKHWWVYADDITPSAISDWECTEGTALDLWQPNDPERKAYFKWHRLRDTPTGRGRGAELVRSEKHERRGPPPPGAIRLR